MATEENIAGRDAPQAASQEPGLPRALPAGSSVGALNRLVAWAQAPRAWSLGRLRWTATTQTRVLLAAELLVVALWAISFTRPFLDLDPQVVPNARDYSGIFTYHFWTRAAECGQCALWSSSTRGGSPALVDALYTSMLHPLVMLTTLGWGVENGAKLTLVASFIMAGLAQWWLAYLLGVGRVARVFSATMVVVAAHLAGRIDVAAPGLQLGTACAALVLPAVILLARTGSRRAAVLVALALTLTGLAGEGYIQAGLAFTLPWATLLLVRWDRAWLVLLARRMALAMGITLLLAAPFLLPFFHFMPEFAKDVDPAFHSAQPFAYVPLNLVIADKAFYLSDALGKIPIETVNVNYVGWVPVLLALWGLGGARTDEQRRIIRFLVVLAVLALWFASSAPLTVLVTMSPIPWLSQQLLAGLRFPGFMSGLAIAPILGLAAVGVDRILRSGGWRLGLAVDVGSSAPWLIRLDPRWLLIVPLLWAINDGRNVSSQWIGASRLPPEMPAVLAALRTPDLQWVSTPFGEHGYVAPAIAAGLKLSDDWRDWHWKNHVLPEPVLQAHRGNELAGMTERTTAAGVYILEAPPGREYASVTMNDGQRAVCTAHGVGGDLDVSCDQPEAGLLTVRENNWTGWQAQVDGRSAALNPGQWLAVNLEAGSHQVEFHYRPWDAPLSILLCLLGVALAVWAWMKDDRSQLSNE